MLLNLGILFQDDSENFMQVNPLLLEKIDLFLLINPEYISVAIILDVLAAPERLYLECTSLMQLDSPEFGDKLLHHSQQHLISFVSSILVLRVQELDLVGFIQKLHKKVSIFLSLDPASVNTLNF